MRARPKARWLVGAVALAVVCGATGTAGATTNETAASPVNIMWLQPLRNHPVHRIMQAGFLAECKKLGAHCEIVGNPSATQWDVPSSLSLAAAAMAREHFNAVGVYAGDPALYPFIKKLNKQHLPVVSWHFPLKKGTVPGLTAITGCKPDVYARQVAIVMGKEMGGKGTVALTQGGFNPTENLVSKTFTATMKAKYPNIKVLKPQLEDFEPSKAIAKAVGILQANPDVTAAFSTTGNGPETWSGAERQAGKKLTIISMDYVRQNLDLVKSGAVYAIVAQPLFQEGAKTADLLYAAAKGKPISYYNWLPAPIVTKDKTGPYYKLLDQAGQ